MGLELMSKVYLYTVVLLLAPILLCYLAIGCIGLGSYINRKIQSNKELQPAMERLMGIALILALTIFPSLIIAAIFYIFRS